MQYCFNIHIIFPFGAGGVVRKPWPGTPPISNLVGNSFTVLTTIILKVPLKPVEPQSNKAVIIITYYWMDNKYR